MCLGFWVFRNLGIQGFGRFDFYVGVLGFRFRLRWKTGLH